jgi:hypothetical protein
MHLTFNQDYTGSTPVALIFFLPCNKEFKKMVFEAEVVEALVCGTRN